MPILSADIKLLKSEVMADTDDGGGQMTGHDVIDGQSNNLFPDTSAMDRGFGRIAMRKVFGVAHTDDTDTLLGAHAVITQAPSDPLVHCSLIKTAGWADTRTKARDAIERYVVKGSKLAGRLYDMHYAGSLSVRLMSFLTGVVWPSAGDCIVLRTPQGVEQYVRLVKVSVASEQVAVTENGSVSVFTASVATCTLGQELQYDFNGPPAVRVIVDSEYTQVYGTNPSVGAKFYGVKALATSGSIGDYTISVAGGIYTPVVPAATVESPIIDVYPLTERMSVSRTALAAVTLPAVTRTLGPGSIIKTPTPIEPGSLLVQHGGVTLTDDAGVLKQSGTTVGTVNYSAGTATLGDAAPVYGNASCAVTLRPACAGQPATHSTSLAITSANQGLSFVQAFEPPPAPGTLSVSYMAQNRWYDLSDNAAGKVSGTDTSYGVGQVNYTTGSHSLTLGAIPDVGSFILFSWGDAASAVALPGTMPTRLTANLGDFYRAQPSTITVSWARAGTNYTATANSSGALSGGAGTLAAFAPAVLPDGPVSITYEELAQAYQQGVGYISESGGYINFTLGHTPVSPQSVRFTAPVVDQSGVDLPSSLSVVDDGSGNLVGTDLRNGHTAAVGTIDYVTGAVALSKSAALGAYKTIVHQSASGAYYLSREFQSVAVELRTSGGAIDYAAGASTTTQTVNITPIWQLLLPVSSGTSVMDSGLLFTVAGEVYSAASGVLRKGWDTAAGTATVAHAGTANSLGVITLTALPTASGNNTVVVCGAPQNRAAGMTLAQGVFRVASAPLKPAAFQLQVGADIANANADGILSGGGFSGTVDFARGIVRWSRAADITTTPGYLAWVSGGYGIDPAALSYNAVFLQYLPLDPTLLSLDTARLPLDGKVVIYRPGDLCLIHNTQTLVLPNPVPRDSAHSFGRVRVAAVRVLDALDAVVADTLYTTDLDAGTITFPASSNLTAYTQPLRAEHRIEDLLLMSQADISGQLKFTRSITHDYPADTSFVSSVLPIGDVFARAHNVVEQQTWTGEWSDDRIGPVITANFNQSAYPVATTNRGAITERWALIFTGSTAFRVIGESVGEIATGNTAADCAPINPATGSPYFTLPSLGFGAGWSAGNVLRFNTDACGAPFWVVRTVLQGPASVLSDKFTVAFRGDVDRP